jgi:ADP-ribosylglycohydrolase
VRVLSPETDRRKAICEQLSIKDRILGCLLGGACGDALGAPVEFLKDQQIRDKYGSEGIRDFDNAYGSIGAITDDTQMSLFTVEGIIRAWVRQQGTGHLPPTWSDSPRLPALA